MTKMLARPRYTDDTGQTPGGHVAPHKHEDGATLMADNEGGWAALGALVRQRRTEREMSMEGLAQVAGVGRTSLHRLEHGQGQRPNPSKLARVLKLLDVTTDEVHATLGGGRAADELTAWMDRADRLDEVTDYLHGHRQKPSGAATPDLVLLHPDGSTIYLQVRAEGEGWPEHRTELLRAMARVGYIATTPVE